MMRLDIKKTVGQYLTALMNAELTHFLGREPYERGKGEVNHRNGTYDRNFTLKEIGEVQVKTPRDQECDFKTNVIPPEQAVRRRDQPGFKPDVFNGNQYPESFHNLP